MAVWKQLAFVPDVVSLQSTTPGTAQTGNLNITGTITVANIACASYLATGAMQMGSNSISRWMIGAAGHFFSLSDNAYDFGNTGGRVRTLYVGTSVGIGVTAAPTSKLAVVGLVDYANNAAAVTAGLAAGAFYTETGTNPKKVCVVY